MGNSTIPLSVPALRGNEWAYVKECLDTNWVSYVGPFVERFERDLAAASGASFAVATASGTAALHVALILAGVKPEEEVVMPAVTFVAPANAVRYCLAWPALIDIRATDWQLDVQRLSDFLERGCVSRNGTLFNRATGRRIAAILPVHLLGGMADIDAIAELASRYELPLIEDAAECLGATYKDRPIGAPCPAYKGPLRLVATSFNGNKIITTGGGGALFAADPALARRAKHLTTTAKADKLEFFHDEVGYNYRLTNVAAALGVAQLEKLAEYVEEKRATARFYHQQFASMEGVTVHPEPPHCRSTFWLYTIKLAQAARPVIDELNKAGVMARPIWVPLSRLPAFAGNVYSAETPCTDEFYRCALNLPCSVGITTDERTRVAAALADCLSPAIAPLIA